MLFRSGLLKVAGDQLFFGGKVFVDGGIANIRSTRDLLHRRALKPLLGHQVYRRLDDEPVVLGLLSFGGAHVLLSPSKLTL